MTFFNHAKNFFTHNVKSLFARCVKTRRSSRSTSPRMVIGTPTNFRKETTPYASLTNLTDAQSELLRQAQVAELVSHYPIHYPTSPIELPNYPNTGKAGTADANAGDGGAGFSDLDI
ncbi:MAG: hypothetical protein MMC33_008205 [Icmadophila ericetorum]|nr:hypothetical protein [Icmadophila ericetorum]